MARSTDASDYQDVPVPVAAMSKTFPGDHRIAAHCHARDQLLYAVSGTMRIRARSNAWIVPPDRALYVPAAVEHEVEMRGAVEMRTLYIAVGAHQGLPREPRVMTVGPLLRALVLALMKEPVFYGAEERGGHIAALILDEIERSPTLTLAIPLPSDRRLERLCTSVMADPARRDTLGRLAERSGASARTLARLFQRECGMSFTAWRQRVRFYNALEELSKGTAVGRVAHRNGYRSASAFSAAFRRLLGFSPGRDAGASLNRSAGGEPSQPVRARPLSSG